MKIIICNLVNWQEFCINYQARKKSPHKLHKPQTVTDLNSKTNFCKIEIQIYRLKSLIRGFCCLPTDLFPSIYPSIIRRMISYFLPFIMWPRYFILSRIRHPLVFVFCRALLHCSLSESTKCLICVCTHVTGRQLYVFPFRDSESSFRNHNIETM